MLSTQALGAYKEPNDRFDTFEAVAGSAETGMESLMDARDVPTPGRAANGHVRLVA